MGAGGSSAISSVPISVGTLNELVGLPMGYPLGSSVWVEETQCWWLVRNAGTVDGKTVLASSGAPFVWQRWNQATTENVSWLNAQQYGCKADAVTDCTAAATALANYAVALPVPATLYFPKGTYRFSSFWQLANLTAFGLRIWGDGWDNTIFQFDGTSDINGIFSLSANNLEISFLKVQSHPTLGAGICRAINLNGGARILLRDVWIDNLQRNPSVGVIAGVNLDNCTDVRLSGVRFTNIHNNTFNCQAVQAGVNSPCQRITISDIDAQIAAWNGVAVFDGSDCLVEGGIIDLQGQPINQPDGAGYGVIFYRSLPTLPKRNRVVGATIKNTAANGIAFFGSVESEAAACTLENTCISVLATSLAIGAIGVQGRFDQQVSLTDCAIKQSGQYGIVLQGDGITLHNCSVEQTTLAAIAHMGGMGFSGVGCRMRKASYGFQVPTNTFPAAGSLWLKDAELADCTIEDVVNSAVSVPNGWKVDVHHNTFRLAGNRAVDIPAGRFNSVTYNKGTIFGDDAINVASSDSLVDHNEIQAAHIAGLRSSGDRNVVTDNVLWGAGDAAKITGTVDLTTLAYGAGGSLDGKTLIMTTDLFGAQTVTFVAPDDPDSVARIINTSVQGIWAHISAANRLELYSETGGANAQVNVTGGTGAATLGVAAATANGNAPVADSAVITGTDVVRRGNRFSATGSLRGSVALGGAATVVANVEIRTGDRVKLVRQTLGAGAGFIGYSTIVNATSFRIDSSNAGDNGTIDYEIEH